MAITVVTVVGVTLLFLLAIGTLHNVTTAIESLTAELRREHEERLKADADREQRSWHQQKDAAAMSHRGRH